jgi:L-ribulose-5-phosphate 3-epimerase
MTRLGIMQGRLSEPIGNAIQSFPVDNWRDEFPRAAAAGLATIEWIYDTHGEGVNPLETDEGIDELLARSAESGVVVASVCADWFIPNRLVRVAAEELAQRVDRLRWLLVRCERLGARRLVLPFVDESALLSRGDEQASVTALRGILDDTECAEVELHLETSLDHDEFASLLSDLDHELVKVNYDSGNSAYLGFDPRLEFAAYGNRIGSIHVKDRLRAGTSVPLGEGDADLESVFALAAQIGFDGDYVLQVARGPLGSEVEWAIANRRLVEGLVERSLT